MSINRIHEGNDRELIITSDCNNVITIRINNLESLTKELICVTRQEAIDIMLSLSEAINKVN